MDFSVWEYLKQQMYATPPLMLPDLQRRPTDAFASASQRVQREVQVVFLIVTSL